MQPNVCLVVLDAVRAANVSCYGHQRQTTPNIDDLAEESLIFERATAPSTVTLDSSASLFTGQHPAVHQAGLQGVLSNGVPQLPELFKRAGYRTGAITTNPFITPGFGFERGVDHFHSVEHRFPTGMNIRKFFDRHKHRPAYQVYLHFFWEALDRNLAANIGNALQFRFDLFTREDTGGEEATAEATKFARAETPWFLYLHYTESHMKNIEELYQAPPEYLYTFVDEERVKRSSINRQDATGYTEETRDVHQRLYDGTIRYQDHRVGELIRYLKSTGQWDETLFIVTADHGELLGEHDELGHGILYEPGVHVPLIVKPSVGQSMDDVRTDYRVNTGGLYASLADITGTTEAVEHTPIANVFTEPSDHTLVQDYSTAWDWSSYAGDQQGKHAYYEDELKLIKIGDRMELYDIASDPDELTDLASESERTEQLASKLNNLLGSFETSATSESQLDIDSGTTERLEDLGYL